MGGLINLCHESARLKEMQQVKVESGRKKGWWERKDGGEEKSIDYFIYF